MNKWIATLLAAMAVALLPACSDDSGSDNNGGGNSTEASVTLTGRMSETDQKNADQNSTSLRGVTAAVNYADYQLYCVTFTDPPHSGTGTFDDTGNFSVTIDDAAGLSIGCFITDASGASVATVTFNTGSDSGLGDGDSGSMALDTGTYEINIQFDPVTGSALADVSMITQADTSGGTLDPTVLAGSWTLTCPADDPSCEFGDNGQSVKTIDVYFNIVNATEDLSGVTVHGMGVWPSKTDYQTCGGTEQLNFPVGLGSFGQTGSDQVPTMPFKGFYTDNVTNQRFVDFPAASVTKAQMAATTGQNLLDWMTSLGNSRDSAYVGAAYTYPAYDFYTPWNKGGSFKCPGTDNADFFVGIADPFVSLEVRQCVINWFQILQEFGPVDMNGDPINGTGPLSCLPRLGSEIWDSPYLRWSDPTDPLANKFTGASPFLINKPDEAAEIRPRMAIMPLAVEGDTAVAFDHWEDNWTEWSYDAQSGTESSKACTAGSEMQIAFVPSSTDPSQGKAFFTVNEWEWCDGDTASNGYRSFVVDMTKTAAP